MPTKRKLTIEICEICGFNDKCAIQAHHIIPRTDPNCTNAESNLAYVCANCHNLIHANHIIIEGRFMTTRGQKLFWHKYNEQFVVIPGVILNQDGTATIKRS